MRDAYQELYETAKLDRKNSQFSKKYDLKMRLEELQSEVNEIRQALNNNDNENLKEEFGDALWDLTFLMVIAEEQKLFEAKEVIETVLKKFNRRKPWIFNGEQLTAEEEDRRWKEAKRKEKELRSTQKGCSKKTY